MEGRQVIRNDSCPLSCNGEEITEMRKGPWTDDEDAILAGYVAAHGEGRWNTTARLAGLKRTGKSCRLRWLNYLRPSVRRGSITLQEQLLILQLRSRWGNRWSKIAQYLPGRTDNEIKNYWRTRVQKLAKRLKCDVNSEQFRNSIHQVWIPRLIELIRAADSGSSTGQSSRSADCCLNRNSNYQDDNIDHILATEAFHHVNESGSEGFDSNFMPELLGSPSYSLDSRVLLDYSDSENPSWGCSLGGGLTGSGLRPGDDGAFCGWHCQSSSYKKCYGVEDVEAFESEPQRNGLMGGRDGSLESLWIDEKILFLSRL